MPLGPRDSRRRVWRRKSKARYKRRSATQKTPQRTLRTNWPRKPTTISDFGLVQYPPRRPQRGPAFGCLEDFGVVYRSLLGPCNKTRLGHGAARHRHDRRRQPADRLPCGLSSYRTRPRPLGQSSMPGLVGAAGCLEQEPRSSFGVVDIDFQKARGRNVIMFVAERMRLAHACRDRLVVGHQFDEHVERRDKIRVIVLYSHELADMANRAHGSTAKFADALGQRIGSGENLIRLFVKHEMIVTKMRPS